METILQTELNELLDRRACFQDIQIFKFLSLELWNLLARWVLVWRAAFVFFSRTLHYLPGPETDYYIVIDSTPTSN